MAGKVGSGEVRCRWLRLGLSRELKQKKKRGKIMVYKWNVNVAGVKAQDVGELCEKLKSTVGLSPETLLNASRSEGSLLHNQFEWNDGVAAEKYRAEQARHIICNLKVIVAENTEPTRAFVTIQHSYGSTSGYEHVVDVMSNEEKRAKLLESAKEELRWFKVRYQNLKELANVMKAIDEVCD